MPTSLTVYGLTGTSTVIGTARTLATQGGSNNNADAIRRIGTATGWGELWGAGAVAWPALGSPSTPTGNGFLLDSTLLAGYAIVAGNWSFKLRMSVTHGSITADLRSRFYRYSTATSTYTAIGEVTLAGQTLSPSIENYLSGNVALPTMACASTDRLYVDIWMHITASSTGSSLADVWHRGISSIATGTDDCYWITPGYDPTISQFVNVTVTARSGTVTIAGRG
jgi:hypothetical protein